MKLSKHNPINEPIVETIELINILKNHGDFRSLNKNVIIQFNRNQQKICYSILTGSVSLVRSSDGLVLANLLSPTFLGFGLVSVDDMHIKTLEECQIKVITYSKAYELIDSNNLWRLMTYHLMSLFDKLWKTKKMLTAGSSYKLIKFQLQELMGEPEIYRNQTSAELYIQNKTGLSRSGIMSILGHLKKGGYIDMKKGILLAIHFLPNDF